MGHGLLRAGGLALVVALAGPGGTAGEPLPPRKPAPAAPVFRAGSDAVPRIGPRRLAIPDSDRLRGTIRKSRGDNFYVVLPPNDAGLDSLMSDVSALGAARGLPRDAEPEPGWQGFRFLDAGDEAE